MADPGNGRPRRAVLGAAAGAVIAALAGCTGSSSSSPAATPPTETPAPTTAPPDTTTASPDDEPGTSTTAPTWRELELTDVLSGETFTVGGFVGQPVLLEFFAVWCPVCTAQQKAVREALAHRPELVPISLNVDPNEGEDQVREHVQAHDGFDWRYAVASTTMTHRLIQEFGSVIANPPAAPVVRVCPDGTASLLDERGAKPAEALLASFDAC